MAALRNGLQKLIHLNYFKITSNKFNQVRYATIGEPIRDSPVVPRRYEVSRDPEVWRAVTRLLPQRTVPPVSEKSDYPSGWTPPTENGKTQPYFVQRSKNHMLGLYLDNEKRGELKITTIKRIQGDIWLLHEELKAYVEEKVGRKISSQVLECNSIIKLKGDHYHWAEEWLLQKGF